MIPIVNVPISWKKRPEIGRNEQAESSVECAEIRITGKWTGHRFQPLPLRGVIGMLIKGRAPDNIDYAPAPVCGTGWERQLIDRTDLTQASYSY